MYIESVNLGIDHSGTSLLQHLGVKFSGDGESYEIEQLICQYNMFMDDLNFDYVGGVDPHYSVDRLIPNQSTCLYKSDDGYGRVYAKDAGNYRAISSSVVFGAFKNGDSLNVRPYLMSEMINFLLGVTTITSFTELADNESVSVSNYPNPFTQSTNFEFTLRNSENVKLNIFDEMGRLIYNFTDEQMNAGTHLKTWNAINQQGNRINRGIYFYRLTIGETINSGKILLLD